MKYVLCHPGQKRPIGDAWQNHTLTWEQVTERLKNDPTLNVGVVLGPESGVVDVECDSDAATASYRELFAEIRGNAVLVPTPSILPLLCSRQRVACLPSPRNREEAVYSASPPNEFPMFEDGHTYALAG